MPRIVADNQIPPNTETLPEPAPPGTELHLIEPLGFELSDKYLKRAGMIINNTCP
jgi:tRNA (cytidine/uridine-2'-O-)-methyltransferase